MNLASQSSSVGNVRKTEKEGIMLRKKMSLAVLLVGAVVSGPISTASASSCASLVGTWLVDTKSTVPVLRPVTFTVNSGGTMSNVSGTNIVVLGFTDRSGLHGECSNIGPRLYRVMLEELLYKDGLFAGRFLLDMMVEHDPRTDTIAGVSGHTPQKGASNMSSRDERAVA
jgi:hypothetical protein